MLESTLYLRNQLLRDSDWASMAHSLELRTPLVDAQLLATLGSHGASFEDGMGKDMLAHAPERPLPEMVVNRRKTGFSVPMASWLSKWIDHRIVVRPAHACAGEHAVGATLGQDRRRRDSRMRMIHVVPAISEEASGPSYSVPRLCESLIAAGVDVQLAALQRPSTRAPLSFLKTFPSGLGPPRLGVSPKMRRWLNDQAASGRIDIMHNHSLWMMPNVYPGRACRHGHCRLVVSPRGTLSSWALGRNAAQKKIFWRWVQEPALRDAACFHATAESEYADIRRLGFKQPICILPNGIDLPRLEPTARCGRRQILFLGRIHPTKGVEVLLRAWQAVAQRFPDWELRIVGPEEGGYLAQMQALAAQLRLERIEFPGPVYGEDKLRAYSSASFVCATHLFRKLRHDGGGGVGGGHPGHRDARRAVGGIGGARRRVVDRDRIGPTGRLSGAGAFDFAATSPGNGSCRPRVDAARFFVAADRPPIPGGLSVVARRRRAP